MEHFFQKKEKNPKNESGEINALHSEHLKEGIKPIMAGLIDLENLDEESVQRINEIRDSGENVDWFENSSALKERGMKNPAAFTYVISGIDGKNKFSESYGPCTGVALVGIDKKTGENISFLSHQDPEQFLAKYKNKFSHDLSKSIEKMIHECEPGTVDAVVFGGSADDPYEYIDSIKLLGEICKEELGFEPVVLTGPNDYYWKGGRTHVYFDTENRRLHIVRPPQGQKISNQSFIPSDRFPR